MTNSKKSAAVVNRLDLNCKMINEFKSRSQNKMDYFQLIEKRKSSYYNYHPSQKTTARLDNSDIADLEPAHQLIQIVGPNHKFVSENRGVSEYRTSENDRNDLIRISDNRGISQSRAIEKRESAIPPGIPTRNPTRQDT